MRALHPKMSMSSTKSRLHASVMQKKVPRCVQANENSVEIFLFITLYYNTMTWACQKQETVVFTGKTKNTLWPVLLQFSFSLQSLNYRFLLKKYGGKASALKNLCCDNKILTKTLPPFVWVKAIKKIKSKLLDYNVTIKMNTVNYRLFCENTYCI